MNRYLGSLSEEYDITFGSFDVKNVGNVEIGDFRIATKGEGESRDIFSSPKVLVTYDWKNFNKTRKLDSILVKSPSLYIDEETLEKIIATAETGKRDGIDLKALSYFTGSFVVEEGDLFLDLPTSPPIRARWDFQTEKLGYGKDGLTIHPFLTELRNLEIGDQGVFGKIDRVHTHWRFNSKLSKVKLDDLIIDNPVITVMPEWLTLNDDGELEPVPSGTVPPLNLELAEFVVKNPNIKILGFDGSDSPYVIPDISFESVGVEWKDLFIKNGRLDSKGPVTLKARDVKIGGGRANLVEADVADFAADSLGAIVHDKRLSFAKGKNAKILISDDSLAIWNDKELPPISKKRKPFRIDVLDLPEAEYLMTDFIPRKIGKSLPRLETGITTTLKGVWFDKAGMHMTDEQSAELKNFVLHGPGVVEQKVPLINFPKGTLKLDWERFINSKEMDEVIIEQPAISLTDDSLGEWAVNDDLQDGLNGPNDAPVYKVKDIELSDGTLVADSRLVLDGMIPKVKGNFTLENAGEGSEEEFEYQLVISDLLLSNHSQEGGGNSEIPSLFPGSVLPDGEPLKSEEVVKVEKAIIDFTAAGLQRQRRIKKVKLEGGVLRVGEGLKDVVKKPSENQEAPPVPISSKSPGNQDPNSVVAELMPVGNPAMAIPKGTEPEEGGKLEDPVEMADLIPGPETLQEGRTSDSGSFPAMNDPGNPGGSSLDILLAENGINGKRKPLWKIDDLEITRGKVNFESLIPEMDGLSFGLETEMKDIPLTAEGLLDATKPQTVKLDSLRIRDPYDAFLTVAELPDVYVEFSLAGLANQEIEKIDVISPTLNVGESLFRWIDYLRKYRAINEGTTVDLKGANIIDDKLEGRMNASKWIINRINATSGKLVISPYGHPITSIPFPFSATTNVAEGKVKMEMNISEEQTVFSLPDYGIDLIGLTGDLGFNLPIPEKDNNLVQTFRLNGLKWRKFDARKLFLTVTYDRYGIYGLFGGEAYGGYANGAFNYYLDKNGKWDAWLAGTNMDTGAVTKALVPEGFVMGGKVNTKLFGKGTNTEVDGIDGELESVGDGWFDIALMEKALEHLPENWSGIQKGISKIAVDNLRRFDYHQGEGQVYLKGNSGLLKLQFAGEYGKRSLNLHIHDWRDRKDTLAETRNDIQTD
ncbi:MAG: hypothetical protein P1U89_00770 [Verrucomicrobiales bacterium]|nr:hypothetical protein [Verrucomicrobiales bacterium]